MPDLKPEVWALIGGAVVVLFILIGLGAARRGREQEHAEQQVRRSQTVRVVMVVVLLALIVALGVANAQSVTVDWIFARSAAPLVLVVALSGFVGFLVGALIAYRSKSDRQ